MSAPRKVPKRKPQLRYGNPKMRTTQQRVDELINLMVTGQYVTHVTCRALAEQWGIAEKTVENLACEASRTIRLVVTSSTDFRARILANLETMMSISMRKGKIRDGIEAARVMVGVVESQTRNERLDHAALPPMDRRLKALHEVVDQMGPELLDQMAQEELGGDEEEES